MHLPYLSPSVTAYYVYRIASTKLSTLEAGRRCSKVPLNRPKGARAVAFSRARVYASIEGESGTDGRWRCAFPRIAPTAINSSGGKVGGGSGVARTCTVLRACRHARTHAHTPLHCEVRSRSHRLSVTAGAASTAPPDRRTAHTHGTHVSRRSRTRGHACADTRR